MNRIFVATPCHRCDHERVKELATWARQTLESSGLQGTLGVVTNCPWLDAARADLVAAFTASDCTHLLFRDDDIDFSGATLKSMVLSSGGRSIVRVPYRERLAPHNWAREGLGCCLIPRGVIERMIAHFPELRYMQNGEERFALFHHMFSGLGDQRILLKEDAAFFARSRQVFAPVVDISAEVTHGGVVSNWPND
jgi:hypothetical protein